MYAQESMVYRVPCLAFGAQGSKSGSLEFVDRNPAVAL